MDFFLPELLHIPSPNFSQRSAAIDQLIAHDCEGSGPGSVNWFAQRASEVSAHIVLYEDGKTAVQMVPFAMKAWHACAFNSRSIGVELAGYSKNGFPEGEWQADANIMAWLMHTYKIPCVDAGDGEGPGITSHYRLGRPGGGHSDPTTDDAVWQKFFERVKMAYDGLQDALLPGWGSHSAAPLEATSTPPEAPTDYIPSGDIRKEPHDLPPINFPVGSVAWLQQRLTAKGFATKIDGLMGPATRSAIVQFQRSRRLSLVDGIAGPQTKLALAA